MLISSVGLRPVLGSLKLEKHPDKTFIGRIERGFDFLGYHFRPNRLSVAAKTIENFVARAIRLYEQEPEEAFASARLGLYVRRWVRWARSGVAQCQKAGFVSPNPLAVGDRFAVHCVAICSA